MKTDYREDTDVPVDNMQYRYRIDFKLETANVIPEGG